LNSYSQKTHILLFVVLGVLLYWYTLPYPFVFDSRFYLVNNPLITDFGSFVKLLDIPDLADDYIELNIHRDVVVTFILRPFANFTFYLNYLFNGFNPESFRVFNIAIHIFNTILWYLLLTGIIRHRNGGDYPGQQWFLAFFPALLFLVHPLNTESVTYIIQRFATLSSFFYLATMLLFNVSLLSPSKRWQQAAWAASVITLLLGMLSKESLVTAPLALVVVGTLLLRLPLRKVLVRASVHICCLPLIPFVAYLVTSAQAGAERSFPAVSRVVDGYPPYEYVLTQTRVVLTYFRMLIAPYGQNIDPDYPLYRSIANPEVLVSLAVIGSFLVAAFALCRRKAGRFSDDLLSFCIFFSLLSISISSLYPLPDLMAEHHTYLFSLPVITGLICRFDSVRTRLAPVWTTRMIFFLSMMVVLFSALTVKRNLVYRSQSSLWEDAVSKSPGKWRPNYNAGNACIDEQQYEKALYFFRRSIQINPLKVEGYSNLGSTCLLLSDYHTAIEAFRAGLALGGDDPVLLVNLGTAYREAGQLQDAIDVLEKSVREYPDLVISYRILAELYVGLGQKKHALRNVRMARALDAADAQLAALEEEIVKLK
jgi:tetratricopeptide (TPR) repeat protein